MAQTQMAAWQKHDRSYVFHHRWVDLNQISPNLPLAVVASEDQKFPEHWGFDVEAIAKAYELNQHSHRVHGASTISQQVAKNLFLWSGRSSFRKGLEAYFTDLGHREGLRAQSAQPPRARRQYHQPAGRQESVLMVRAQLFSQRPGGVLHRSWPSRRPTSSISTATACTAPVPSASRSPRICSYGPGAAIFAKAWRRTSPCSSKPVGLSGGFWRFT